MKNLITILSILLFAVTQNAYAGWRVTSSVSFNETKMEEEKNCFVISDFVEPIRTPGFSDKNLKQAIGVGVKDDGTIRGATWAYLVFNDSPALTGYRDRGKYRIITHRARFDEEIISITYREGDPDRFMHIDEVEFSAYLSDVKLIGYVLNSKTLLTEQEHSDNGNFYYKHDLRGFKEKYREAREWCGLETTETILTSFKETERIIIRDRAHLVDTIKILTTIYGNEVNLNHLDVSGITDFSGLFKDHEAFNGDISGWDVSAGTDFSDMFWDATSFNQDIGGWDVSAGIDFNGMFLGASAFNRDIGGWDVAVGTDFRDMFSEAGSFSQDLSRWEVSPEAITNYMFEDSGVTDFTSYPWWEK